MYRKYMIVCEVFGYFIFGMYFLFFKSWTSNTSAAGPKNLKKKKEKIIKKK